MESKANPSDFCAFSYYFLSHFLHGKNFFDVGTTLGFEATP